MGRRTKAAKEAPTEISGPGTSTAEPPAASRTPAAAAPLIHAPVELLELARMRPSRTNTRGSTNGPAFGELVDLVGRVFVSHFSTCRSPQRFSRGRGGSA